MEAEQAARIAATLVFVSTIPEAVLLCQRSMIRGRQRAMMVLYYPVSSEAVWSHTNQCRRELAHWLESMEIIEGGKA